MPQNFSRSRQLRRLRRRAIQISSQDARLINRDAPGAKPSLHQDKRRNRIPRAPIVSVSLGLP
ncbi:hypothetical protein ACNKHR_22770 [Shigella flexneri]